MFDGLPTYSPYRTLKLSSPAMRGEDVWCLQAALAGIGFDPHGLDGIFGSDTRAAVLAFQKATWPADPRQQDGLAGQGTQRALLVELMSPQTIAYRLPEGALYGQVAHESSFLLGNYAPHPSDPFFDAGATQRNTEHTASIKEAFDPLASVDLLGANLRSHYDLFSKTDATHPGITSRRRRWELAMASWNAPAYACRMAREEGAAVPLSLCAKSVPDAERVRLEAYMDSASAYLKL